MGRRASWRAVRIHRSYTVDQAARMLGVCKATVRRWIKLGLPALTEQKPALILGRELRRYLQERKSRKRCCAPDQFFCFSCREPKRAAFGEAEIASRVSASVNLRALCEECSSLMHKRVSAKLIVHPEAIPGLRIAQAHKHLIDQANPCPNVHLLHGRVAHGEAQSEERAREAPLPRISGGGDAHVLRERRRRGGGHRAV